MSKPIKLDNVLIRGTTPTFTLRLPEVINNDIIANVNITFAQANSSKISVGYEQCIIEDNLIMFTLTQQETFGLIPNYPCQIEANILFNNSNRVASYIFQEQVDDNLYKEIMTAAEVGESGYSSDTNTELFAATNQYIDVVLGQAIHIDIPIDEHYNATSPHAQSGIAVAEAIAQHDADENAHKDLFDAVELGFENVASDISELRSKDTLLSEQIDNLDTSTEVLSQRIDDATGKIDTNLAAINRLRERADNVDRKIPAQATASNQLADKAYVDDAINSVAAYFITKNIQGDSFATNAELRSATVFYSGGEVRVPTKNDYCIVLADETKINPVTKEAPTTRYIYNSRWEFQYIINTSTLTAAQMAAINSGATKELIDSIPTKATREEAQAYANAKVVRRAMSYNPGNGRVQTSITESDLLDFMNGRIALFCSFTDGSETTELVQTAVRLSWTDVYATTFTANGKYRLDYNPTSKWVVTKIEPAGIDKFIINGTLGPQLSNYQWRVMIDKTVGEIANAVNNKQIVECYLGEEIYYLTVRSLGSDFKLCNASIDRIKTVWMWIEPDAPSSIPNAWLNITPVQSIEEKVEEIDPDVEEGDGYYPTTYAVYTAPELQNFYNKSDINAKLAVAMISYDAAAEQWTINKTWQELMQMDRLVASYTYKDPETDTGFVYYTLGNYVDGRFDGVESVVFKFDNVQFNEEFKTLTIRYSHPEYEGEEDSITATIETPLSQKVDTLATQMGNVDDLQTDDKSDLVSAINEVNVKASSSQIARVRFWYDVVEGQWQADRSWSELEGLEVEGVYYYVNDDVSNYFEDTIVVKGDRRFQSSPVHLEQLQFKFNKVYFNNEIKNLTLTIGEDDGEEFVSGRVNDILENDIGNLIDLQTEDKDNLVNAINEVNRQVVEGLNTKLEMAEYSYDGHIITKDGTQVEFQQVKSDCDDNTKFVYLEYENVWFIPTYIVDNIIYFIRTTISSNGTTKVYKITFDNEENITYTSKDIADRNLTGSLTNLETTSKANLVAAINEVNTKAGQSGKVVNIGSYQYSYDGYVLPAIPVTILRQLYIDDKAGVPQTLYWTLPDTENNLKIVSSDYIGGYYSIDILVHNKYHCEYKWDDSTTGNVNPNIDGLGAYVKTITLTQAEFDALTTYQPGTNYQIIEG